MLKTLSRYARWLPLFCALLTGNIALADAPRITLRGLDGDTSVSGTLINFDGTTYRINTALGEMHLEASQVSCEGVDCPTTPQALQSSELALAVGSDLAPGLLPLLIENYALERNDTLVRALDGTGNVALRILGDGPETRITTLSQKPGFAFAALSEGLADLALTLQKPTSDTITVARANQTASLDDEAFQEIVALDAIALVVASTNPVRTLSAEQITDIFAGRIANWSALGGPNAPIRPVFAQSVLALPNSPVESLIQGTALSASAQALASASAVSDAVAADPYAIGMTTFSNLRGASPVAIKANCGLITLPNRSAILTGTYPYTQQIIAYSALADKSTAHTDLTNYLASDAAQDAVSDAGFVGQNIATISLDGQGQRFVTAMLNAQSKQDQASLRSLLSEIAEADRLSPTFRFKPGGDVLDQHAASNAVRLARYINSRDLTNRELLFVGFTDSLGSDARNRELSAARAKLVMDKVSNMLTPEVAKNFTAKSIGFGAAAPIACNDTAHGQSANRRVEVWLRPRALASQ